MWTTWPRGFPDDQLTFLAATPDHRARIIAGVDQEQAASNARKAARTVSGFDGGQILIMAFREQLHAAGVTDDQIDQRIAGEWAGLPATRLIHSMKLWALDVRAG